MDTPTINYSSINQRKQFLSKYPEFNPLRDFKKGELGIFASNYQAWNKFLKSDFDYLLIMEDDIKLDNNFIDGINSYLERLPKDWDFFSPFVHWWQSANLYNKETHDYGDKDICKSFQTWSLACYFISKQGAKKILESLNNGFEDPVDWYIFKNTELFNIYTLKPEANRFCDLLYLDTTIQNYESQVYPNWFEQGALFYFEQHMPVFKGKDNLQFLQIGTYTGDASLWMLKNILTGENSYLTDIDTWGGSEESEHKAFNWDDVEDVYDKKVSVYSNVIKYKGSSIDFLNKANNFYYDFIYIDGDHTEKAVYDDAIFSWNKLKTGGILAFDDYQWVHESGLDSLRPGPAIDRFVEEKKNKIEILESRWQYWIRKI
jgi:GR25 family glycosyltransferase involved in LPS biosynthesis